MSLKAVPQFQVPAATNYYWPGVSVTSVHCTSSGIVVPVVVVLGLDLDDTHCYSSSHIKPYPYPLDCHIGAL